MYFNKIMMINKINKFQYQSMSLRSMFLRIQVFRQIGLVLIWQRAWPSAGLKNRQKALEAILKPLHRGKVMGQVPLMRAIELRCRAAIKLVYQISCSHLKMSKFKSQIIKIMLNCSRKKTNIRVRKCRIKKNCDPQLFTDLR